MMKIKFLIFGVLMSSVLEISAQEKKDSVLRFSLSEAQAYAIENSYNVQIAKLDLEIARKKIFETTAIGLPQVSGTAQYQNIFNVPQFPNANLTINGTPIDMRNGTTINNGDLLGYQYQSLSLGVKENVTFDLTVSQLIFSGEYIVGLQASRVFREFSEQALTKSKNDIRESASKSYCLALVTEANIKIVQQSLDLIDQLFSEMKQLNAQGLNESTDVDQMEITKSNIENLANSLNNQHKVALKLLKFQMGIDIDTTIVLTDSIPSIIDAGNNSYINSAAFNLDNNIDFKIMKTQEKLSLLSLRREKTKFLPTVAGFYRHEELAKKPLINFNPPDVLGISVNVPIFSSGMKIAQVKEAKLNFEKAKNYRQQFGQALSMDFYQSKNAYETSYNSYLSQKKNLDLSQRIFNKTVIKYKAGVSSSFELNQIQNQFLVTQGSYFIAVMDLFNAKTKLEKLLSTIQ
jgi:outer membrane protein